MYTDKGKKEGVIKLLLLLCYNKSHDHHLIQEQNLNNIRHSAKITVTKVHNQ